MSALPVAESAKLTRKPTVITPKDIPWVAYVREMWEYRELLYFMIWRDFIVRYKQTKAGMWWAILQPLLGLAVYWWAFGVVARIPSGNTPYPLFIFAGLIPFTFVSDYLCRAVDSVTGNKDLVGKVYFPRIYPALSGMFISLVDFFIMLGVMALLMAFYGCYPGRSLLLLPALILVAVSISLETGLFLAAANVHYRDVAQATGLFVRFLYFASPAFYHRSMVPAKILQANDLNPMSAIICGFRWTLFSPDRPKIQAVVVSVLALLLGLEFFRHLDKNIADTI